VDSLGREIRENKIEVVQLESRLQELTSLYRAISTVNAVNDDRETYDAVLRAALDLVGADRGSLMLVDSANKSLVFASAVGLEERILNGPGLRIGDGVAGWVAKKAEPVLLTGDIDEDGPFEMMGKQDGEMNMSMSVPLQLGERVIGVLNLGSSVHAEKQSFSKEELRFAYLFAQHAAIAVDRSKVLGRTRRARARGGAGTTEFPTTSPAVRARTMEN
jgi:GAF domain-containing protein